MKKRGGLVFKGVLAMALVIGVSGLITIGFFLKTAVPQVASGELSLFCAPSQIGPGESWILLGSQSDLPKDLEVNPLVKGVDILEKQWISTSVLCVRLKVGENVEGKLLQVSSEANNAAIQPTLTLGATPTSPTVDKSFSQADLVENKLLVEGDFFIYGYLPTEGKTLDAVRIHNRATGEWSRHEHALMRAIPKEEPLGLDPSFVEVDVFQTLPDTNGDGIYDFEELPEEKPAIPEQMGVTLKPGLNILDLVVVDEAKFVSWRQIEVFSTWEPEGE